MSADHKVKLPLRPSLSGAGAGAINRPDINSSPSKLMINHGKPNYTINRSGANTKNKQVTTEIDKSTPQQLFSLKPTNFSTTQSSSSSTQLSTSAVSSPTNQIEKIVLKHVETPNSQIRSTPPAVLNSKPPSSSMISFVSPGISSKAAATSFGVKLKQCNNKKNLQNGGFSNSNGNSICNQKTQDEPEFVKRQKQIFEKLQQKSEQKQQQTQIEINTANSQENASHRNDNEISSNQNNETNGHDSLEENHNYVRNCANRIENVSSPAVVSSSYFQQQQQNSNFKLPPNAVCGKPAIPGKPTNLQFQNGKFIPQQLNNMAKVEINSRQETNGDSDNTLNNTEIVTNATNKVTPIVEIENEPTKIDSVNVDPIIETGSCESVNLDEKQKSHSPNFEQKTFVSFSKELSTEPNRYPDVVKIAKTDENGFTGEDDEYDQDLNDFVAIENSTKLAEDLSHLKFDIKTDEENISVTPVLIQ